jgi:hypothetical protein
VGTSALRIKSASAFEFHAANRQITLAHFRQALDLACAAHGQVRAHNITEDDDSLKITIELESGSWGEAEETVLQVIEAAVADIDGAITTVPPEKRYENATALFGQLGTHLLPA